MNVHDGGSPEAFTADPATSPDPAREIAELRVALETRDVIGQAKGIVRMLGRTSGDAAFDVLARMSQETNRKLRDVATVVADCAGSGRPLPPDLRASWQRNTATLAGPDPVTAAGDPPGDLRTHAPRDLG